jgi:hypothetical protein
MPVIMDRCQFVVMTSMYLHLVLRVIMRIARHMGMQQPGWQQHKADAVKNANSGEGLTHALSVA